MGRQRQDWEVDDANLYCVDGQDQLKPCEMPAEKVLDFLRGLRAP